MSSSAAKPKKSTTCKPLAKTVSKTTNGKTSLDTFAGERRVIVDRVQPSVDQGMFPIKRVVGDKVVVEADVFADGHDRIMVVLKYRKRGERTWKEKPMEFMMNDRWLAEFTPTEPGFYEYAVSGWIDHFGTWLSGLRKKAESGIDVSIDLLIGADLIEAVAQRTEGSEDSRILRSWVETLRNRDFKEDDRVAMALGQMVIKMMNRYPDRSRETGGDTIYPLLAERERARCGAWYEFFPRSWSGEPGRHGTFEDCERILPEIARMGFNIIYLPPIHPIGRTKRKGRNNSLVCGPDDVGSPWAIGSEHGGHKAVASELGGLEQFKHFLWSASKCGLEVAIDIAFQCSPDHPYVKKHPEWFTWRSDGTVQYAENPPKKYEDVLPFNFETETWPALWEELKSVFMFWIEQGVKIFRVDNPHTKPMDFWRWCIMEIKQEHPDTIFLAEAFTRPKIKYRLAKAGFTQGYTYFAWRNSREELMDYVTELTTTQVKEIFWPNFWPNTPDILTEVLQYGGRQAHIIRLVLAATLSSNYGIYGPAFELCLQEPFPDKEEYNHNEKYELKNWNWDAPGNLKDIIALINKIRRENPALQRTNNISFVETDNPQLLAYLKSTPDYSNNVLVVVNLDPYNGHAGWLTFPLHMIEMYDDRPFLVNDMLQEANYMWQGARNYIQLEQEALPAHIFRVFRKQRRESDFDYWL